MKIVYYIKKTIEISAAHKLSLDYPSKCSTLHGHNWLVTIECKSEKLNECGMVIDFSKIKSIAEELDHKEINIGVNPTAENIAKHLCDRIPYCFRVSVQETEGNVATYCKPE